MPDLNIPDTRVIIFILHVKKIAAYFWEYNLKQT